MGVGLHHVIFDGISTADARIFLSQSATYGSPKRTVTKKSVPGRNGDIIFDEGRYENAEIRYKVFCNGNFKEAIEWIRNTFGTRQDDYFVLSDSYRPNEFRMARFSSEINPTTYAMRTSGECELVFDCKPQRWLFEGEKVIDATAGITINNPTENASNPTIRVYGNGTVTIGSLTITIAQNTLSYIDIDSESKNCYCGNTNANPYVSIPNYKFPTIKKGKSQISKTGSISKLEIIPRWWIL